MQGIPYMLQPDIIPTIYTFPITVFHDEKICITDQIIYGIINYKLYLLQFGENLYYEETSYSICLEI